MQLTININKKHLYVFVALTVLLFSVVLVKGFGSSNPVRLGHSAGEIIEDDPQVGTLTAGQWCQANGTGMTCNITPVTNNSQLANGAGYSTGAHTVNTDFCSGGSCSGNLDVRSFDVYVLTLHMESLGAGSSNNNFNPLCYGADDTILECIGTTANPISLDGEVLISGVTGSGKAVCVTAGGYLGVCSDAVGGSGTCTCA